MVKHKLQTTTALAMAVVDQRGLQQQSWSRGGLSGDGRGRALALLSLACEVTSDELARSDVRERLRTRATTAAAAATASARVSRSGSVLERPQQVATAGTCTRATTTGCGGRNVCKTYLQERPQLQEQPQQVATAGACARASAVAATAACTLSVCESNSSGRGNCERATSPEMFREKL